MKAENTIRKQEKELRKFIDNGKLKTKQDVVENRLAYLVESALRWVRLETVGWGGRIDDVKDNAKILLDELAKIQP